MLICHLGFSWTGRDGIATRIETNRIGMDPLRSNLRHLPGPDSLWARCANKALSFV